MSNRSNAVALLLTLVVSVQSPVIAETLEANSKPREAHSTMLDVILYYVVPAGAVTWLGYLIKETYFAKKPADITISAPRQLTSLEDLRIDAQRRMQPPMRSVLGSGSSSTPEIALVNQTARTEPTRNRPNDVIEREGTDARFLRLHDLLFTHSPLFRQMHETLQRERNGRRIRILPQTDFEFDACWHNERSAVMLTNPGSMSDDVVGASILFELGNALHQHEFERIRAQALQGYYERYHPADPRQAFAFDNEEIEQRSIQNHRRVIAEAIANSAGQIGEGWDSYSGYSRITSEHMSQYIRADFAESHIDYWKRAYDRLKSDVERIRIAGASDRVRRCGRPAVGASPEPNV